MALDITRLSGGNTPADGSDPRTFPAIWNATSDALEADVIPADVTSPATGQLLQYNGTNWVNVGQADAGAIPVFADAAARTTAIPSPSEGMVTYLSDVNQVQAFTGSAFTAVGSILQVVSTAKTNIFTTASTSFVSVTDLSASITPSSTSSKILVFAQLSGSSQSSASNAGIQWRISGGGASSFVGDAAGNRTRAIQGAVSGTFGALNSAVSHAIYPFIGIYLDSPNTVSPTTYQVEVKSTSSGTTVVNGQFDGDATTVTRGASSITLMEVAG